MRNIKEVNINSGGKSVKILPPSEQDIREFQTFFEVILPPSYLMMLSSANGGHPELDCFSYNNGEGEGHVDTFFHLTHDKEDPYGLWKNTEAIRNIINSQGIVAIGMNAGDDIIFLKLDKDREEVFIFYRAENSIVKISNGFEAFIDSLYMNPDYI